MIRLRYLIYLFLLVFCTSSSAQTTYPKVTAYVGIVHPIATFSKDETVTNFKDFYLVGFPTGINIWKSRKVGFSFEVIPSIKAENGVSRMNNFVFHPGILLSMGKGFTFAGRAAFETSGRYGLTPVFNKAIIKSKNCNYYVAVPLPVRFGNDKPASFTLGFQFGIAF